MSEVIVITVVTFEAFKPPCQLLLLTESVQVEKPSDPQTTSTKEALKRNQHCSNHERQ